VAQVPYEGGAPTVSPEVRAPDDYQHIQVNPEQFGAAVGQGLEKFGAGATKAGQYFGEVAADDQFNKYQNDIDTLLHGDPNKKGPDGQPLPGFLSLKGQAATQAWPGVREQLEAKRKQYRETLGTPEQQFQFDRQSQRYYSYAIGQVGTHADREYNAWYTDVEKASGANALRGISNAVVSDNLSEQQKGEAIAHNESDLINSRLKTAQRIGAQPGDAVWNATIEDARRDALKARLEAISVNRPADALRILEKNKQVAGSSYETLANQFRTRALHQTASDGVERAAQKANAQPASILPASGDARQMDMGTVTNIAATVSSGETGNRNITTAGLAQISPDAGGTKSYGILGLNSGVRSGSAARFIGEYGRQFGLTAPIGTPQFDAQWRAAASNNTEAFKNAQLNYFRDHDLASVTNDLKVRGIPSEVVGDPRVLTYFADRHVQMDTIGLDNVGQAWATAGGDVPRFLRNMNAIDARPENLQTHFRTAIASGVYGERGNATRLERRLNGALQGDMINFKADVYRNIQSDPDIPQEGKQIAFMLANQRLTAAQVASEQDAKAKKDAVEQAAGGYTTEMWDMAHGKNPNFTDLTDRINHDPNLDFRVKDALLDRATKLAGGDETISFGPGYLSARDALFSAPDAPNHISGFSSLINDPTITTRGLNDLKQRWELGKKSFDRQSTEQRANSYLKAAYKKLSFEGEGDNPWIKTRDPKGEKIFLEQFQPDFIKQLSRLMTDSAESGKTKELDEFLSKENVDKMVRNYRDPRQMALDRMAALGEGTATQEPAGTPLPQAPEGVDAKAWQSVIAKPPAMSTGLVPTHHQYGIAIETLLQNPTPKSEAQFDKWFGAEGARAKDVLGKLKPKPAEQGAPQDVYQPPAPPAAPSQYEQTRRFFTPTSEQMELAREGREAIR
jgi:hypothetical protein